MKRLFLAALATVYSVCAFAWAGLGHQTIVAIAENNITERAKANISKYMPYSMVKDAVWMDRHRKDKPYAHTGYWHSCRVDEKRGYIINRDYRQKHGTVLTALQVADYNLSDWENASDSVVLINLRMLIHFVGDMHCPCHLGHSHEKTCKGKLSVNGKDYTFHKLYDAMPSFIWKGKKASEVAKELGTLKKGEIKKTVKGTPEQWAIESAKDCQLVYDLNPETKADFDPQTIEKSEELIRLQLTRAGYRLAYLLNKYFDR